MYMVWHALCLYYFDSFSPAQCSQYLPYIGFDIFVYYLTTIFGGQRRYDTSIPIWYALNYSCPFWTSCAFYLWFADLHLF